MSYAVSLVHADTQAIRERVDWVSQVLEQHGERLDGIDGTLASHGEMLREILRRLPPAADTPPE